MKLITCIVLALTSFSFAQHPQDLVSPDALAVLSIKNASSIQTSLNAISSKSVGSPIDDVLSQFIKNPTAIDYSKGVLLTIEPGVMPEGQRPTGMFGAMPHLVVICKPKAGQTLQLNSFSGVNTSTMHEGWFVAAGGNSWSPPEGGKVSPIFAQLPEGQVSLHVMFGKLWSQIGPITQMAGGMMIGQMNKPGPTGVIDTGTRKQTAAISQAFRKVMQFCSQINSISASATLNRGVLGSEIMVERKNLSEVIVDNTTMFEMATSLRGGTLQYSMSGEFTSVLMDYQLGLMANDFDAFPIVTVTEVMRELTHLQGDNVVMYDLDSKEGLTIHALAETTDAEAYLSKAATSIDEMTDQFASQFQMELEPNAKYPTTWDVNMIGDDASDMKVMHTIVPVDTVFSFGQLGNWVSFIFGPKSSLPFAKSQGANNLSKLIASNKELSIEFAMSLDARKFAGAIMAIAESAGTDTGSNKIASTPSAVIEAVLGSKGKGWKFKTEMDLAGLAKLTEEME
jgi:hypothetical protein